jgi:hypothetical protein
MTGTDALVSAGLDFVSGLRMGLPPIIQMSEILARPFYGWHGNRADLDCFQSVWTLTESRLPNMLLVLCCTVNWFPLPKGIRGD